VKIIRFLFRQSPLPLAVATFAGILSGLATTGLVTVIHRGVAATESVPAWLLWAFLGLCAARLLTYFASQVLLVRLAQQAAYDLRMRLCRRILAAPLRQLEKIGASRILAVLTNDVVTLTTAFAGLPTLIINFTIVAGCLVYLGYLSWQLLVAVAAFLVFGVVSYQIPVSRGHNYVRIQREDHDALYHHFRAVTEGAKELKLNHAKRWSFLTDLLDDTARALRKNNVTAGTIFGLAAGWSQILWLLSIGLLLFILPRWLSFEPGEVAGATVVILFIGGPIESVVGWITNLSRAAVSLAKIESLGLSVEPGFRGRDEAPEPPAGWRHLELAGVTHVYHREAENRNFTLGPLALTIEAGELVFITGGNGSGKTTLAKLITGLYTPEDGELRLDGEPVTDDNREAFRQLFSVVFWDFFLFEQLLGLEGQGLEEQARRYLETLQLEHKVSVADGRLSTLDLSQGQRKRLALLGAYLEDRPIYLFDEWAADQDPLFREVFYRQLLPQLKARGKTVLVISHDDRYYDIADRLIKLENGRVIEDRRQRGSRLEAVPEAVRPTPDASAAGLETGE
jgi:putative ATP-binding cassette transporter